MNKQPLQATQTKHLFPNPFHAGQTNNFERSKCTIIKDLRYLFKGQSPCMHALQMRATIRSLFSPFKKLPHNFSTTIIASMKPASSNSSCPERMFACVLVQTPKSIPSSFPTVRKTPNHLNGSLQNINYRTDFLAHGLMNCCLAINNVIQAMLHRGTVWTMRISLWRCVQTHMPKQ